MKNCVFLLSVTFLAFILGCRKKENIDPNQPLIIKPCDYDAEYKVENVILTQNKVDSTTCYNYDSLIFNISRHGTYYLYPEILAYCAPEGHVVVDYYKSINVITLNKYNEEYNAFDTITENLADIQYHFVNRKGITTIYRFNSFKEFFNYYTGKPDVCGVSFKFATPPDSIRELKLKIKIKFWDNREFVLYSKPVFVAP